MSSHLRGFIVYIYSYFRRLQLIVNFAGSRSSQLVALTYAESLDHKTVSKDVELDEKAKEPSKLNQIFFKFVTWFVHLQIYMYIFID